MSLHQTYIAASQIYLSRIKLYSYKYSYNNKMMMRQCK